MTIVSWNCTMGFSKMRHLIEALEPDIAILAETRRRDGVDVTKFPPKRRRSPSAMLRSYLRLRRFAEVETEPQRPSVDGHPEPVAAVPP